MLSRDDEQYTRMREFSRVDAAIPFGVSVVPAERRAALKSKLSGNMDLVDMRMLPDLDNKALHDWLIMLNSKLDTIINMLSFQREGFGMLPFTTVNISGGGLSFTSAQRYNRGDLIEMKMLLPLMPPVALYVYGEIVSIEKSGESYAMAVKFLAMDDNIQDLIVQFVFKQQREILRERRK
ncbi:MAG: PilZ domain-containing protein [Nitrospirae bacterium]|nr:MAG: PilZ domain-containing protein [Nitrospirota bacterium]